MSEASKEELKAKAELLQVSETGATGSFIPQRHLPEFWGT